MSLLVFDIETYRTRDPEAVAAVREAAMLKPCPSNAKKELKLSWDTEGARTARADEALAKTSLDPLLAEPIVVAWRTENENSTSARLMHVRDDWTALAADWDEIAGKDTTWCGHNIEGFDLPILLNTFRRWSVVPPAWFPRYRGGRWRGRVYDTMLATPCRNGLGMVSLDNASKAYGLPPAKSVTWHGAPMNGARVAEAYEAKEYELLLEYCTADVEAEYDLYMVQTCAEKWSAWGTDDELREAIREIRATVEGDTAQILAIYHVLKSAGRVPE